MATYGRVTVLVRDLRIGDVMLPAGEPTGWDVVELAPLGRQHSVKVRRPGNGEEWLLLSAVDSVMVRGYVTACGGVETYLPANKVQEEMQYVFVNC